MKQINDITHKQASQDKKQQESEQRLMSEIELMQQRIQEA